MNLIIYNHTFIYFFFIKTFSPYWRRSSIRHLSLYSTYAKPKVLIFNVISQPPCFSKQIWNQTQPELSSHNNTKYFITNIRAAYRCDIIKYSKYCPHNQRCSNDAVAVAESTNKYRWLTMCKCLSVCVSGPKRYFCYRKYLCRRWRIRTHFWECNWVSESSRHANNPSTCRCTPSAVWKHCRPTSHQWCAILDRHFRNDNRTLPPPNNTIMTLPVFDDVLRVDVFVRFSALRLIRNVVVVVQQTTPMWLIVLMFT